MNQDPDTQAAIASVISTLATDLGESPEAWRGATVVFGRIGQVLSSALSHTAADATLPKDDRLSTGAVMGVMILTEIAVEFEKLTLVDAAQRAQGWK